jgi:hypothetical protein
LKENIRNDVIELLKTQSLGDSRDKPIKTQSVDNSTDKQIKMQQKTDFGTLIDLKDFKFILKPQQCSELENKPEVVVLIVSGAGYAEPRQTIRDTWGKSSGRMLVFFLLGGVENIEDQKKIDEEFQVGTSNDLHEIS